MRRAEQKTTVEAIEDLHAAVAKLGTSVAEFGASLRRPVGIPAAELSARWQRLRKLGRL